MHRHNKGVGASALRRGRWMSTLLATMLLLGCTAFSPPQLHRGTPPTGAADGQELAGMDSARAGAPRARIRRGSGELINQQAATAPPPAVEDTGDVVLNFEGESIHEVVRVILGELLGENYAIAPEVQGSVTYASAQPITPAQALNVLEMALAWNDARLVYADGRYHVVPADSALAGLSARSGAAASARGFETRVVMLRYIAAAEMEKLLKPYARPGAIVAVDAGRNAITVAGSRAELDNYLRTINVFDVDWLAGMSVGVFPLQSGRALRVTADLEKVFGDNSGSPVAGMFRFMPLEGANAIVVITPQPAYLAQIQAWLEEIDRAGQEPRLYAWELRYVRARELAQRLAEVFAGGTSGEDEGIQPPVLMPGLTPSVLESDGLESGGGLGAGGGLGSGMLSLSPKGTGSGAVSLDIGGDHVGVAAVEETNTLLVRTTPGAWSSIREVIERLDVMPMQVHIEAQVATVQLTGALEYGVNWYLEHAAIEAGLPSLDLNVNPNLPRNWSTLGASVTGGGMSWTLFKNDAAAIIRALDQVTNVRLLQTPSVFVRNNVEATLNVGDRIPVASTSVNPIGGSDTSLTQVQYLETGTILKVRPRVTREGMVFLDIVQEISAPVGNADANGNYRISTRRLKTEAVAQDGDTVILAGLINDSSETRSSGIPWLSRLPVIGSLFGTQGTRNERSETIVLITARIVPNAREAREFTDEYSRRFRAMEPLPQGREQAKSPALEHPRP